MNCQNYSLMATNNISLYLKMFLSLRRSHPLLERLSPSFIPLCIPSWISSIPRKAMCVAEYLPQLCCLTNSRNHVSSSLVFCRQGSPWGRGGKPGQMPWAPCFGGPYRAVQSGQGPSCRAHLVLMTLHHHHLHIQPPNPTTTSFFASRPRTG